jgi:hypothetical protein
MVQIHSPRPLFPLWIQYFKLRFPFRLLARIWVQQVQVRGFSSKT